MTKMGKSPQAGSGVRRSPGVSYQDLLDQETRPVPAHLRLDAGAYLGDHDIPIAGYLDRAYHDLETEKIWKKVWQVTIREERIPNVGDVDLYEINNIQVFIVRTGPDEIKGYYNACLHMGRTLVDRACRLKEIRCPYHGFTWAMNGKIKNIPSWWDFPQIKANAFSLPEVKVGLWGGFVFINMDPDCEPFGTFLGTLNEHFEKYRYAERYTASHVIKVLRCNWKVAQEAFMDAYHVIGTHPQILTSAGDENSQCDAFEGENFSRVITPAGVSSPHLDWTPTEDDISANVYRPKDDSGQVAVPEGMSYRQYGASLAREQLREVIGDLADELCDSECMDSFFYTLFPNFHPFGAYNQTCQIFRPYKDRQDMCTMEVLRLRPFKGERPAPAKPTFLDADQSFIDAPELGVSGALMSQDEWNLEKVQRGLHTLRLNKPGVTLAIYQHAQARHFYNIYATRIGDPPGPTEGEGRVS
jgi:phenylpropionate dioxygenase-like ring-hydroxylating dioxygenase large terminal subunit